MGGGELTDLDWTDMWRRRERGGVGAGGSDPFKSLRVVFSCTLMFVKQVKGERVSLWVLCRPTCFKSFWVLLSVICFHVCFLF